MTTPFVLDNLRNRLADTLNQLLESCAGKPLDIATAYFSISGYRILKDGLHQLGAFRLLLGTDPQSGADVGLKVDTRGEDKHCTHTSDLPSSRSGAPVRLQYALPARLLRPLTRTARARPRNRATDVQDEARHNGSCSAGVGRRGQPLVSLPQRRGRIETACPRSHLP